VSPEQRMAALQTATERRVRLAELRRELTRDRTALRRVLADPPPELANMAMVDVVRLAWGRRSSPSLARLGRLAVRDGVNLMMPLGEASVHTRAWMARNAIWNHTPSRARERVS
jgi:hypothetical protein